MPEHKNLKLLAKSPEEYISFQFGCFKFLDSYRFLQSSLDNITKSMTDDDFKITRHQFPNTTDFKLLRKKGSVPYSFYTSHESYNVTYLEKSMFFDELKNEMAPDSAYDEAKVIWDHFKISNHGEYIDLYLKTDVILLADLFEKFRDVNLNYFQIDPCHCYSAPGLTWQAGLKYTGINLELLTDTNILLTFEKAIRGGISGVMGTRHIKADESHKLLYIDANNLYGWAMMEPQPYGSFEMIDNSTQNDSHISKEQIMAIPSDSEVGYFLEVDLEYPGNIKFKSRNFPFCPESLFIEDDELSPYQRELLGDDKRSNVEKLILTQKDKTNYIVHYRMLQFYLKHGMVLKRVHSVIRFKQSKWLAPYIDFNTKRRMDSKTDFEKDYFKL
ncbi:DNA polymerase, partial [Bartonella sp. CL34QHWL]|uniref:DNA polymerase n=1 Tax=Bartonella sp. CL34QHWL TaxID=3243526 RepID=UPI0035D08C45